MNGTRKATRSRRTRLQQHMMPSDSNDGQGGRDQVTQKYALEIYMAFGRSNWSYSTWKHRRTGISRMYWPLKPLHSLLILLWRCNRDHLCFHRESCTMSAYTVSRVIAERLMHESPTECVQDIQIRCVSCFHPAVPLTEHPSKGEVNNSHLRSRSSDHETI